MTTETQTVVTLQKGDKVIHPHHGGGVVVDVFEQEFNEQLMEYYLIHTIIDSLQLYIPSRSVDRVNIRKVEDSEVLSICLTMMQEEKNFALIKNPTPLENKVREKIKTGLLAELAESIGLICKFKQQREREGKINVLNKNLTDLLNHAKKLFVSHMALIHNEQYATSQAQLQKILDTSFAR